MHSPGVPNAAKNFGDFTGELLYKLTSSAGDLERRLIQRAENVENEHFQRVYHTIKENQEIIAKTLFWIGVAYNCWQSSLVFVGGISVGALASGRVSPISLESLQQKLFGDTAEEGYALQHFMFVTAAINAYLGDTLLDNSFFGLFTGLVVGNALYHSASDSFPGKVLREVGDGMSTKILSPVLDAITRKR